MNYLVRQAIKWRKNHQERNSRVEKIINTIRSCKTDEQLLTAIKLVDVSARNHVEKQQFDDVILEVAVNQAKDVTAQHFTSHDCFLYNSLLWHITGEKKEDGLKVNRAVFIPRSMEVDLSKYNFAKKVRGL